MSNHVLSENLEQFRYGTRWVWKIKFTIKPPIKNSLSNNVLNWLKIDLY